MHYVPEGIPIFYVDPKPAIQESKGLTIIAKTATEGVEDLSKYLERL